METNATEENITKYLSALQDLKIILRATNRISLNKFSIDNNISKNSSIVLSKGGIIKCTKKGKGSTWEWTSTVEPNRQMAIRLLKGLGKQNPKRGGKREGAGRLSGSKNLNRRKIITNVDFLWGLYSKTTTQH